MGWREGKGREGIVTHHPKGDGANFFSHDLRHGGLDEGSCDDARKEAGKRKF